LDRKASFKENQVTMYFYSPDPIPHPSGLQISPFTDTHIFIKEKALVYIFPESIVQFLPTNVKLRSDYLGAA